MHKKRPESVLVVIYDQNNRILGLQRKDDPDFWQSVTGSLEAGELPHETARREVTEEIGINASLYELEETGLIYRYQIRPEWQHRYPDGETENKEYCFLLKVRGDEAIALTEHLQYRWMSPEDAVNTFWSPSNRELIQKFFAVEGKHQRRL